MIVADASAIVEILLGSPAAGTIKARLSAPGETLHAPHLLDIEVTQVLRRQVNRGEIDGEYGRRALAIFAVMPFQRYPQTRLLPRIWELRDNLTAYDAAYVALAEALDAPLLTRDGRLAGAAGHSARIELV